MKKSSKILLFFSFLFCFAQFSAFAIENTPAVTADGMVLMDARTGQILLQKNMHNTYPPASTTKIMTALLTLENADLSEKVTVGDRPPYLDGSKIGIDVGEIVTVEDLLYGLLLQSGNDCAATLAEYISGSSESFAELMNKRAQELGCESTNFVNPHGLYDDNHRTSAYDLALILKELYKHPEYTQIATTAEYVMPPTNKTPEQRHLWNKNKLITGSSKYRYEYNTGGKTGYTMESKHSFVATAEKENHKLIAVLLHDAAKNYWSDTKELFEYGFNNYESSELFQKGEELTQYKINEEISIPLLVGDDFLYSKDISSDEIPEYKIIEEDLEDISFNKGDNILHAEVSYKGNLIGNLQLIAGTDYVVPSEASLNKILSNKSSTSIWLKIPLILLTIFFLLLIIRTINLRRRRRKKLERYKKHYKYKKKKTRL